MLTLSKTWAIMKMQRGRRLPAPGRRCTWGVHSKNDWRRVRCTAKAKISTPTARHSLSESSAEQNIRTFSALVAFRQADFNAKRWWVYRAATAAAFQTKTITTVRCPNCAASTVVRRSRKSDKFTLTVLYRSEIIYMSESKPDRLNAEKWIV